MSSCVVPVIRRALFVYEIDVDEAHRRRVVGTSFMRELAAAARDRSISSGFALTNASNEPAMRFYESLGGERQSDDDVLWDFRFADG